MSPAQRAQVLYLYQVEGVSIVLIVAMTGLSRSMVQRVLHDARQQDALQPEHKGHVERPFHFVRLRPETAVPPQRPHRRERRRDRT